MTIGLLPYGKFLEREFKLKEHENIFFFLILRLLIHVAKLPNLSGFISLHLHHQYTAKLPVAQSSDVLLSICHPDEPKRLSLVQRAFLLLVKRLGIFPNFEK